MFVCIHICVIYDTAIVHINLILKCTEMYYKELDHVL